MKQTFPGIPMDPIMPLCYFWIIFTRNALLWRTVHSLHSILSQHQVRPQWVWPARRVEESRSLIAYLYVLGIVPFFCILSCHPTLSEKETKETKSILNVLMLNTLDLMYPWLLKAYHRIFQKNRWLISSYTESTFKK